MVINFVVMDNSHWLVIIMRVVMMVVVIIGFLTVMVDMVYNNWFMVIASVSMVYDWFVVISYGNMWVLSIVVDLSTLDGRFGWQVTMWSNNNVLMRVSIEELTVIRAKVEVTRTSCRGNNKSSSESCEGFH